MAEDYRYYKDFDNFWRVEVNLQTLRPFTANNWWENFYPGVPQSVWKDGWELIEQKFLSEEEAVAYVRNERFRMTYKPIYSYVDD